jgi:hypothetical protein
MRAAKLYDRYGKVRRTNSFEYFNIVIRPPAIAFLAENASREKENSTLRGRIRFRNSPYPEWNDGLQNWH